MVRTLTVPLPELVIRALLPFGVPSGVMATQCVLYPQAVPPEMRHHLFLTVKEALNNALKHAQPTEIVLGANTAGRQMEIFIQDNGAGFDAAAVAAGSERNGLKNMRRRIEKLGGRLSVDTKPGGGTTIRLTVSYPTGYKPESPESTK